MGLRKPVRKDGKLAVWRLHDIYRQLRLDNNRNNYVDIPLKVTELERIILELFEHRNVTPRDVEDTFY
jgi:hypothetical protein